jgi:hypothetical protein
VRRIGAVLGALLAAVALVSCTETGNERQPMVITSDPDLDAKVDNLRVTGGSAPLRELTGFAWDTVYCYYEGAPADKINSAVGSIVLRPGSYLIVDGALAVFVKDGKVVKPLAIRELVFDRSSFGTGVAVEKGLRLTEPASPPPAR